MTVSTRKHTLRIPAGLSLRRYNPEAAADFDSTPLYLNPRRLAPASLLLTKKASSTLQKILLQRAQGRTLVNKPIYSMLQIFYLSINRALRNPRRLNLHTPWEQLTVLLKGSCWGKTEDTRVHVITPAVCFFQQSGHKKSLLWCILLYRVAGSLCRVLVPTERFWL